MGEEALRPLLDDDTQGDPVDAIVVEDVADLLVHCVAHPCLYKSIETMAAVSTVVLIIAGLGVKEPSTRLR